MAGSLGCPNDAELRTLSSAAPGAAPEGLARHLAGCERCQRRLLFGTERRPDGARAAAKPAPGRLLLVALVLLVAAALSLWTLHRLFAS